MRLAKKITGMILTICLLITLVPTVVYAATGKVSFTDLTTAAGDEFVIKISVKSDTDDIGDVNIVMDFDSTAIEFISGSDVTAEGNVLTYTTEASGTSTYTEVTFRALKFGETTITINNLSVLNSSGTAIEMSEGYSAIVVEGGTEVEVTETTVTGGADTVTVSGVEYTISSESFSSLIPVGYTETTFEYNGNTYYAAQGDASGVMLGCLIDGSGEEKLFYYDEDVATFYPYVQVTISDSTYIIFLQEETDETLSSDYIQTVLTVNDYEFPTWEDTSNSGYYLINAINSNGEVCLYQYDDSEQTYQKYIVEEVVEEVVEETSEAMEPTTIILGGAAVLVVILFIITIVFAIKLNNRNKELDELYDELDQGKVSSKKKEVAVVKPVKKEKKPLPVETFDRIPERDDFEDDFDDDFDDEEYEDDFDDDFDDEEYEDDFDDDFDDEEYEDDFEDDDFDDEEYDDDFDDDFEVTLPKIEEEPKVKNTIRSARAKISKAEQSYDDIDFIDL